ncbi:deoxyribonuclease IV, partial [Desulfobacterota bacterium AH_259_B03_O07]|nr:deoxyribonuclease IV [Desulfobacterota bacterium AH_259_B03_O07]
MKFGAHVSIAGGIDKAPERAYKVGCECFQIFTRSPRGGNPPALDKNLVDSFLSECNKYGFSAYYVHTPYYINLASASKDIRDSSIRIIEEELMRGSMLGVKYIMTHIGSAKDSRRSNAVKAVIEGLRQVLYKSSYKTKLLLENSAGQGATIGDTFEELADILQNVENPELGICLDTAHLFAAGYDIRTKSSLKNVINNLSSIIGLDKLKLLHGNDSKVDLGERKDRHEHIG